MYNPDNYFINDNNFYDNVATTNTLAIPKAERDQLKAITPDSYLGNAEALANDIHKY